MEVPTAKIMLLTMAVSDRMKRETTIKEYTMYGGIGIDREREQPLSIETVERQSRK